MRLNTLGRKAGLFAVGLVALGNALGAAMFGGDFGKDLADTVVVAMVNAAVAVVCVLVGTAVPLLFLPMMVVAVGLPIATPLFVQALKAPQAPEPALALARF